MDNFASRYDVLKEVATEKDGTFRKQARRLEEIKRQASLKQSLGTAAREDFEEPLRLDLLKRQTNEETAIEKKERMRIEEFQMLARLSAEKKKTRLSAQKKKKISQ